MSWTTSAINRTQYDAAWKEVEVLQHQIRMKNVLLHPLARVHHDVLGDV
ncbi:MULTISPECIES: hypothetical protein [Exiguobacterium]|nr:MULTISPECIES: hypothetical protein [Exiguobacterium]MCT4779972.1 hypothetical protein [Exiguobacterium soli]